MDHSSFDFFQQITEAFGPSGAELQVRELIANRVKSFATTLKTDPLGNLIVTKGTGGNILISAHMDEVALTVTGFESDGSLRIAPVGGITPTSLPSKRVIFPERNVCGVIGAKPVHMNRDQKQNLSFSELYIDIGCENELDAKKQIQLGDLAVFDTKTVRLDADNPSFSGKAIDDRLGCYILCKLICDNEIDDCTFLFSVQEEVGLLGASAFAANNRFDYGIALDVTTPNDLPEVKGPNKVCELGKGPVISFADGRCVYNLRLISAIFSLLNKNGIPCQTKALRTGGNEAASFINEGCGMTAISISTPCRYIHGPVGVVWDTDINYTESALRLIVQKIKEGGFECV